MKYEKTMKNQNYQTKVYFYRNLRICENLKNLWKNKKKQIDETTKISMKYKKMINIKI